MDQSPLVLQGDAQAKAAQVSFYSSQHPWLLVLGLVSTHRASLHQNETDVSLFATGGFGAHLVGTLETRAFSSTSFPAALPQTGMGSTKPCT